MVFTWNRKTRKGELYFNGKQVADTTSSYQGQDIDLKLTNHTVYEIGFKKDTGELLQGSLRDLAVFLRTLSPADVSKLYSKFHSFLFLILKAIDVKLPITMRACAGYEMVDCHCNKVRIYIYRAVNNLTSNKRGWNNCFI